MLGMTAEFLQRAHELKLRFLMRSDGINLLRYALKRIQQDPNHPLAKDVVWREAVEKCLGTEAPHLNSLAERRRDSLAGRPYRWALGISFSTPTIRCIRT
jgi:hypothetical protein